MKKILLKDIVKDPTHPFTQDVDKNFSTEPGDELTCVRCHSNYIRGGWDFYSLCSSCFTLFDKQKMEGRFSNDPKKEWFEDPIQWMKAIQTNEQ